MKNFNQSPTYSTEAIKEWRRTYPLTPDGQKMVKAKVNEVRDLIQEKQQSILRLEKQQMRAPVHELWIYEMFLEERKIELRKLFAQKRRWIQLVADDDAMIEVLPESQEYDIETIKRIPIETILPSTVRKVSYHRSIIRCPLHQEKTPSFTIYHQNNTWFCFGCQEHGDVISLKMKLDDIDFRTACHNLQELC